MFVVVFIQRWWKKYSSDCFVVISFSVFIFSMPSKVIIVVVEFMFLGINIRAQFNPRLTVRANMSLSRVENVFNTTLLVQVQIRNKSDNQTSSLKSPNLTFVCTHTRKGSHSWCRTHSLQHSDSTSSCLVCSVFAVFISFVRHLRVPHKVKSCL